MVELTIDERKALDSTVSLWDSFTSLPRQHPDEMAEFKQLIHELQRLIMARPTYRMLQKELEAL